MPEYTVHLTQTRTAYISIEAGNEDEIEQAISDLQQEPADFDQALDGIGETDWGVEDYEEI